MEKPDMKELAIESIEAVEQVKNEIEFELIPPTKEEQKAGMPYNVYYPRNEKARDKRIKWIKDNTSRIPVRKQA
jgi:hypothetical protein